jgi:predicted outer membrane repeat protein
VNASQTANPGDGLTWATAFTALQSALTYPCSTNLAEIWVASGSYKPTATTDRTISFSMKDGVAIYGGFAGGEVSLGARVLTYPSSTTISGEIGDPNSTTDNSAHVISNGPGLTNSAILDGFVITGGYASVSNNNAGGMFNNGNGGVCSPTVRNCVFSNNYARFVGGAIWNYATAGGNSSPVLINCSFVNNSAFDSGGAFTTKETMAPVAPR